MTMMRPILWLQVALAASSVVAEVSIPRKPVGSAPPLPLGTPHPPPDYMRDNRNNYFGTAPDEGSLTGPVLKPLDESSLAQIHGEEHDGKLEARQSSSDSYWLSSLGSAGQMPLAPSGYQFFRNVKDFGAKGDGVTDDTAAINRAAATYGLNNLGKLRCAADCGSTTTLGALVYFPPGTYLISSPIIQYYYTQFVGNPNARATLKGSFNFTGIALVDNNFYIPGGNGRQWYINQSNFYRQIRNLIFDMTAMNWTNHDNGQEYVPAGIHWQVGQATSIHNCDFNMAVSTATQRATGVGIYMENGSGGVVSDLKFFGGNIGFLAGSQQFTATNLQFTSCLTAIYHVWNWGFTWKNIYVLSCYVALDCTTYSGTQKQGTGSITVLDSHFNGVPYAITLGRSGDEQPNIVLDNLLVENSASVVLISGGETLLPGSGPQQYINSWSSGYRYLPGSGSGRKASGFLNPAPNKPAALLDSSGAYYSRSKPQYFGVTPIVATQRGVSNTGTSDQTSAINSLLSSNVGSLIFFPAGIYLVQGTVNIPVGSKIVGSGWSQIMGTGSFFSDANNPKVMVKVGNPGDSGVVEISDMLFTVKGATAGAILMEWNVHQTSQGSAAMWDSHFRVGGAAGTNLQLADCPAQASSVNNKCKAASLLLHVTSRSSGYFDNVWVWVADHDLDNPANAEAYESPEGVPLNVLTQISVYAARGVLIESRGPTWFYGSSSEHAQMYQYQLSGASDIFLGHMQTETPYYQPNPNAQSPYAAGRFPADPTFENCADNLCKSAWALRVVNSTDVLIYSAGFYSFFQDNELGCTAQERCQLALIETDYSQGLWIYNIFTKGNIQIVTPRGGLPPLLFNATTKNGYTSEIAAWLALSTEGKNLGSGGAGGGGDFVTIDPDLWGQPSGSRSVQCLAPCTYVLPPFTLPTPTTFTFPPLTTVIEVGWVTTITYTYLGRPTTSTSYAHINTTTVVTIPPVTTSVVPFFNVPVKDNSTTIWPWPSIQPPPIILSDPTVINRTITQPPKTRTFYPPPWPGSTSPPTTPDDPTKTTPTTTPRDTKFPTVSHTRGPPKPTCTHATGCGSSCKILCNPCWLFCPGPPSLNWWDSDDPDRPPGPGSDPTSECTTATYSSCSTQCISRPSPSPSSCTSTCKNVVGCDTTGTRLSTGFTVPPWFAATLENWNNWPENTATNTRDWPLGTEIYATDHTLPKKTPTCTQPTTTAYPTNTAVNQPDGAGFCYTDSNAPECNKNPYVEFTDQNARDGIQGFCDARKVLPVNGPAQSFVVNDASKGITITVFADWAADQSGCGPKREFAFSGTEVAYQECFYGWNTAFFCTDLEAPLTKSFGGTYILKTPGSGCLLLSLYAHRTGNSARRAAPARLSGGGGGDGVGPPKASRTLEGSLGAASASVVPPAGNGSSPWPDLVTSGRAGTVKVAALFNQSAVDRLVEDFAARIGARAVRLE